MAALNLIKIAKSLGVEVGQAAKPVRDRQGLQNLLVFSASRTGLWRLCDSRLGYLYQEQWISI